MTIPEPKAKYKVRLELSYDGSDYIGWQKQSHSDQTVQGQLEKTLSRLLNEPIQVVGAGRTDAGVHALSQAAHFWTNKDPKNYKWPYCLNGRMTPKSLVIKNAWLAPYEFHATGSSIEKTYRYLVLNQKLPNPFRRNYMTHFPWKLDVDQLNELTKPLLGEHDFKSFQNSGTPVPHTVRQINDAYWLQQSSSVLEFRITGNGFLRQMVRNIVGTLMHLEQKQAKPEKILQILQSKDRQSALESAPAEGLYLYSVKYPSELDKKCLKI